jgi:hypothetical protein
MNFLTHNLLRLLSYSSSVLGFFFEALFVAGFSAAASFFFAVARFVRGAAAAPPRLRRLLSANFAGLASASGCSGLVPFAAGFSSLLKEMVT